MMSNRKRYAIVMALGVIMNLGFYLLASDDVLNLPFWLDFSGTALAAILLEPAAGLLVGFANNFFLAVVLASPGNILYFAASAAVALICGLVMRKEGKVIWKRLPAAMVLVAVATTVLSAVLTIWRTGGPCDSIWERYYYDIAISWGWGPYLSCFFGTLVIKVYDCLATSAILIVFWLLLPKSLKYQGAIKK